MRVKPLSLIVLSLLSLLLIYIGLRFFVAAFFAFQTDQHLDYWQANGNVPKAESWQIAERASDKALAWFPGHKAALQDSRGRVLEWYGFSDWHDTTQAPEHLQNAIQHYREAAALKPLWPYHHRNLAMAKWRGGEWDEEMYGAVEKAFSLGPWESNILRDLTTLSLSVAPADSRYTVKATAVIEHRLQMNPREARAIRRALADSGMSLAVCERLTNASSETIELCPSIQ